MAWIWKKSVLIPFFCVYLHPYFGRKVRWLFVKSRLCVPTVLFLPLRGLSFWISSPFPRYCWRFCGLFASSSTSPHPILTPSLSLVLQASVTAAPTVLSHSMHSCVAHSAPFMTACFSVYICNLTPQANSSSRPSVKSSGSCHSANF